MLFAERVLKGLLAGLWVMPKQPLHGKSHPGMHDDFLLVAQMKPPPPAQLTFHSLCMRVPQETSKPSATGTGCHTGAVRGRREWLGSPTTLSTRPLLPPTGQISEVSGVAVTAASEEDGGCYV